MAVLGGCFLLLGLLSDSTYAFLSGTLSSRLRRSASASQRSASPPGQATWTLVTSLGVGPLLRLAVAVLWAQAGRERWSGSALTPSSPSPGPADCSSGRA